MMFALPHHMELLALPEDNSLNIAAQETYYPVLCTKGILKPIIGTIWNLIYPLSKVSYTYNVDSQMSVGELDEIAVALQADVNILPYSSDDYDFGKEIGRMATLAFTANYLGIPNLLQTAVTNLQNALTPWLQGTNSDYFVYDTTYGGICTSNGINNSGADYGNGWYNDHHFHYGYYTYAFAALVHFAPDYALQYESEMDMIMGDICTPTSTNREFTFARHKDMFDGHSWASGLFQEEAGKNQESSSEATNGYYGCYMYAEAKGIFTRTWKIYLLSILKLYIFKK